MDITPIRTEADYKTALARIEKLMDAHENTPEGDLLDVLVTLVEAYERKHYPVDFPDPVAAIRFYMEQNSLHVPNIITPALRTNNVFQVQGVSIMDGEIWILNREGLLLWHTDNINDTWDATRDGTPLPQGTYVYTIRYRRVPDPGVWLRKTGTVTVIR